MKRFFRNTTILLSITFISLLSSCTNPLLKDPRLYNKKNNKNPSGDSDILLPDDIWGLSFFDKTDKWFNSPDSNGDESNPALMNFSADEFKTISLTSIFDKDNVPVYSMISKDVWESADSSRNEFIHKKAPNSKAQGILPVKEVSYYQYRGKNPCYGENSRYNVALQKTKKGNPRLSRFYFYRFTGKALGIQQLDNFLIAIDTYSKLIFAFSKPVEFSEMGVPTKWAATDNQRINGEAYLFYMYDPIGYVLKEKDGKYNIYMYDWFKENLKQAKYEGKINPAFKEIAQKTPEGAGKSPFRK